MKTIDYDEKETPNTETHLAVDEKIRRRSGNPRHPYEEGFAASSGVRPETAETGGRIAHPETGDEAGTLRRRTSVNKENSGLAES